MGNDDVKALEFSFFPETRDPDLFSDLEFLSFDDFDDFEAEIQAQDELDNDIVSFSFGDGQDGDGTWNVYFGPITGDSFYTFSDDLEEFGEFIGASLEQDRTLLDIDYGDDIWFATFDESDVRTAVSGNDDFDDLTGQIATRDRNDLDLVDLEYGDGAWIARFGDHPGDSTYATREDLEDFQEEIAEQEEDGFDLVDVEYVEGAWYGVFNESETIAAATPSTPLPTISTRDSAPIEELELPDFF